MKVQPIPMQRPAAVTLLVVAAAHAILCASEMRSSESIVQLQTIEFPMTQSVVIGSKFDPIHLPWNTCQIVSTEGMDFEEGSPLFSNQVAEIKPQLPVKAFFVNGERTYLPDLALCRDNAALTYG